jgi:serine/threonine-protein kinase RsbW
MTPSSDQIADRAAVFPGRFDSLSAIIDFVTRAAQSAGLDLPAIHAVQLAVDEACTNIIEHAYGGEGRGEIECCCTITHYSLTVTLCDRGAPFDPGSVPDPDLHSHLENRQEGGLGLFLMRQLMDEIRFQFTPSEGNILTMVKRRKSAA